MAEDRWPELCRLVAKDDGLPTWEEAGYWTKKKLYFWHRYLEITTTAMFGNPTFPDGLVYVDLFAGAGICTLKESKKRIPGSALIAANTNKPFSKIIACEERPEYADACRDRLERTPVAKRCHVLTGDCNQLVGQIAEKIPRNALTLAFVDPKGLDAQFDTIATLSQRGRIDFVFLFADAYDIVRNVRLYDQQGKASKLDQVLGPGTNWRDQWEQLTNRTSDKVRKLFADIYQNQLRRHLGYTHFGEKTMSGTQGPLYRLIYASKHDRGLDFWQKALKKDASGQRELF